MQNQEIEKIEWLFARFIYRVKKYLNTKYDPPFSPTTYEEQVKFDKWFSDHIKKIMIEQRHAESYFLSLIIYLNKILKYQDFKKINFTPKKTCTYFKNSEEKQITTIQQLILFFRNSACHPEDKFFNRKSPTLIKEIIKNNPTKKQKILENNSFCIFYFLENRAISGDAEFYFEDFRKIIKELKKAARN